MKTHFFTWSASYPDYNRRMGAMTIACHSWMHNGTGLALVPKEK